MRSTCCIFSWDKFSLHKRSSYQLIYKGIKQSKFYQILRIIWYHQLCIVKEWLKIIFHLIVGLPTLYPKFLLFYYFCLSSIKTKFISISIKLVRSFLSPRSRAHEPLPTSSPSSSCSFSLTFVARFHHLFQSFIPTDCITVRGAVAAHEVVAERDNTAAAAWRRRGPEAGGGEPHAGIPPSPAVAA